MTVSGTRSEAITSTDVALSIVASSFSALSAEQDISAWFTNLPAGLCAKIKTAVSAGDTSVTATISGTPTQTSSAAMTITVPATALAISSPLSVAANSSAKWSITTLALSGVTLSTQSPASGTQITTTVTPTGGTGTYTWYTNSSASVSGGSVISGATASSYTPGAADVGKYIVVSIEGTGRYSGTQSAVTANKVSAPVTGITLSTNSPVIGTAVTTTIAPAGATVSYQWQSSDDGGATWTDISGATSASFTPTSVQAGKIISVTATGSASYTGTAFAQTTGAVKTGLASVTLSTSAPTVGTAVVATIDPSAATASYQWYTNTASTTTGGTAIAGATGTSYTPVTGDIGKYLYFVATGTANYTSSVSAVTTSKVTVLVTDATVSTSAPSTGTQISVSVTPADATLTYQWKSSGDGGVTWTDIPGATGTCYTPTNADFGKTIKVVITGTGNYSGTTETVLSTPSALGASLTPSSTFVSGSASANMKYTVGEGIPAANLGAAHFGGLTMDGVAVTPAANTFTVSDGSLIITFAQSYLNSLSVGTHTLSVTITGAYAGTYSALIKVTAAPASNSAGPNTADAANSSLWLGMLCASCAALLCCGTLANKKKRAAGKAGSKD